MANLLPGQTIINGVSNFAFGSNMSQDFATHTTRNTPQMQAVIKAGNISLMRCAIPDGSTNAYIDLTANACAAMNCAMLVILIHNDLTWNQHLVSYLGSRCLLYEFANEPDLYAPPDNTPQAYLGWWNSQIPSLRAINPQAAFIGPVMGIYDNFIGSWGQTWLQGVKASGVLPDAVSYHVYPCTGDSSSSSCATKATNFASCFTRADALVKSILGRSLPQCLTEWNMDAAAPPQPYTQDPAFCGTWTTAALNNIAQAGYAIACQWDAGGGAAGGEDDLVSTSTFQPQVQYQPMVNVINSYITGSSGGGGGGNNSRLVGPDTPIGLTQGTKNNAALPSQMISDLTTMGIRWLRWQPYANAIELSKGVYTWGNLDSVVSACNSAGINLNLTVLFPPTWGLITGATGSQVPAPSWTLSFATALATRYDGNHGHGIIQAIELGNEDYAFSDDPVDLCNTLNACYPSLKSSYPTLTIGAGAGIHRKTSTVQTWFSTLWAKAAGKFDYANYHPYCQNNNSSDPSVSGGSAFVSIPDCITIAQNAASAAGFANFRLDITEIGWPVNSNGGFAAQYVVSPTTQSNYLKYCLDQMKALNTSTGAVTKLWIYTLGYANQGTPSVGVGDSLGMSLYQTGYSGNPLPAYTMVQNYPKNWGGGSNPTTTKAVKDWMMRARLANGSGSQTRDWVLRAGLKVAQNLQIKDIALRAGIAGISLVDTFVRANQPQLGTASDGVDVWVQAGGKATSSIVSNQGQVTGATGTNTFRLGTTTLADAEGLLAFSVTQAGDIVGITLRDTSLTSFVRARLTATQLQLVQQTSASFTVLANYAFTPAGATVYQLRFRAVGSNLYAKVWAASGSEPGNWQLSALTTVTGAGQVGIACALSSAGDTALFSSFSATQATNSGLLPNTQAKDIVLRAGIAARVAGTPQIRDVACRARIADTSSSAITVTSYAAKRPPLLRRFPKS